MTFEIGALHRAILLALPIWGHSTLSHAQNASQSTLRNSVELPAITVTADKVQRPLEEVPASVVVIDGLDADALVSAEQCKPIKGLDVDPAAWLGHVVDMVGGEQLAAALEIARHGMRCVLLGAVSAELNPHSATLKAPVALDTFQLILRGVTMCGFSADEQAPQLFDAWIDQAAAWQREGRIHLPHTTFNRLDSAPLALEQACAGRLKGVVLVKLPEPS